MKFGKVEKYKYKNNKLLEMYEVIEDLGFESTTENLTEEMKKKGISALFKNKYNGKFYIFWSSKKVNLDYEIGMKEVLV